jgi:hypothetical protein
LVFHLPAVSEVGGEILFGFLFQPLRERDCIVATGVSGALQQEFWWGFILLCGWACTALFCVTEPENLKSSLCLPSVKVK